MLKDPFSEKEVFSAISDLCGDKASSPNGFFMVFCQFNWDFVKKWVLGGFFKDFHEQCRFVKSLNATFFVLISKWKTIRILWPINLVGDLYKVLVEVLPNRLRR